MVDAIAGQGKGFLLEVVGSRDAGLKQIFSAASPISALIIEYVQRFGDFQGFFTKRQCGQADRRSRRRRICCKDINGNNQ